MYIYIIYSGVNLFSGLGWGQNQDWRGGAKSDHGAKTFYVYLLTSIILCKNTDDFGGGGVVQNDVFARTIYYWVGNIPFAPPKDRRPCIYV